ncbi:hypothetical protein F4604DRAFT_1692421 [Suillus subluteus]|nr:hypothetical protein F4604DRAFT_1692421 [Suillus subluteus]
MSATEKFSGGNKSMVLKLTILVLYQLQSSSELGKAPQLELLKTDCKQKAFLEKYYSPFLEAQLQATVTHFWIPLYAEWFIKWPEVNELFKGQTVPKIHTWFNNRSQKSGKAAVNLMMKSITKLMNNRAKGTRVHSEVEVFSKMMYRESVQEGVKKEIETGALVTKEEKLLGIRELTRKAYEASSDENMTGFEWTVIGAGPDPHLGDITLVSMAKAKTGVIVHLTSLNVISILTWSLLAPFFMTEHVRKTCALNYVPQSPPSTTVIPPTMDFVGAASTSNTSPPVGIPHSQALTPVHVWPDEGFIPSGGLWTFDESNTESFIDETEVLLPAHPATSSLDPHTPLLYNKYQSLSYNPPPSSSQTGTESATVKLTDWYTNFIMDSRSLGPADSDTSSANAISAPSMCLPAQTHAATTTISKQAAAPAVTMDKHLPSLVDASRKTGRIRQATTHLTQANNIGDNGESKMKHKAPITGGHFPLQRDKNYEYLTIYYDLGHTLLEQHKYKNRTRSVVQNNNWRIDEIVSKETRCGMKVKQTELQ